MDGETHINCYGRGRTELGRLLTNFAHTPFDLDGVRFASVEAWWYWRECHDDRLLPLHGYAAKKFGRAVTPRKRMNPPTKSELKRVYHAKLDCNPQLKEMVRASTLPFDHYYEYDGAHVDTKWRWTGQLWDEVRSDLR